MLNPAEPDERSTEPGADVRAVLVSAGIELLREHGLTVGLRGVSIDAASVAAGVSRASSYRAWHDPSDSAGSPRARFDRAVSVKVLTELLADQPHVVTSVFELLQVEAATNHPDELLAFIASLPSSRRATLFARVIMTATAAAIDSLGENSLWHTQIALVASLRSRAGVDDELMNALHDGEENAATHYVEVYQFMLNMFGIRVKPHYRYEHFALAVAALTESFTLRRQLDLTRGVTRPTDEEPGGWTLFGVSAMGMVKEFCEADPDSPFATDPAMC